MFKIKSATKVAKNMNKLLTAAIIATMLATVCVAATEMASASASEFLLKLMAFVSLIVANVYMFAAMFKGNDDDDNHNN